MVDSEIHPLFAKIWRSFRREKEQAKVVDLESNMRPGALSAGGFLGRSESLDSVIQSDGAAVLRLGISYRDIADTLEAILLAALERHWEHPEGFEVGELKVSLQVWRGLQECPWGCSLDVCKKLGFVDFDITNKSLRESVSGPGLIAHLIRDHRFFEGKESPYRVDPEQIARVLGLLKPVQGASPSASVESNAGNRIAGE